MMRHGSVYKTFVYFLCLSFLFLMSGFPRTIAEAKEGALPIGEMISRGEVKFEARENVWKAVASAHFPIFEGMQFKTENGMAFIALDNKSQLEIGENSRFSLQYGGEVYLLRGQISFRIPTDAELIFRVGELSIEKPRPIEASERPLRSSPNNGGVVGSVTLHSNGSVTVNSIRGSLSVQNKNRVVLAAISPEESVTIPSAMAQGEQGIILAQAGEPFEEEGGMEPPFGLESWAYIWVPVGLAAIAVPIVIIAAEDDDDDVVVVSP